MAESRDGTWPSGVAFHPTLPVRPPRALELGGIIQPGIGVRRLAGIGPESVLVPARRVHHPGDVTRGQGIPQAPRVGPR